MKASDRLKDLAQDAMKRTGFKVVRDRYPLDWDETHARIIEQVRPYTMTTPEHVHAMVQATRHVIGHDIPGAIVECGVWRGGSSMAAMLTTLDLGRKDREFWLYDTYEGMTPPTEKDRKAFSGVPAETAMAEVPKTPGFNIWCIADLDDVKSNVATTGYPTDLIHFIKGPVQETLPAEMPEQIALLRLDTDFYDSTLQELIHLWPRLVPGGLVVLDDYGYWEGQRKAVDEYFEEQGIAVFLHRMSALGSIGVKPG
jgi:O-methyltransferase